MIKATDRTKEGLLRKLRVYNLVGVGVFFVVIVALVWQFSVLSHKRNLEKSYVKDTAELKEQTKIKEQEKTVYDSEDWRIFKSAQDS